jgi:hypothetical protein
MKAPKIIWLMLLTAAALCYLQPVLQPAHRIKIENDITDTSSASTASHSSYAYDPYFTNVNDFRQILIPASIPK